MNTDTAELVTVWDEERGEAREVTRADAAAGILRFARSLGPGTPACGTWEQRAAEIARGGRP